MLWLSSSNMVVSNSVQSDWREEFRSFTKDIATLGVQQSNMSTHLTSIGTAVRKDKKIVETGLTLLVHANYSHFGIIALHCHLLLRKII